MVPILFPHSIFPAHDRLPKSSFKHPTFQILEATNVESSILKSTKNLFNKLYEHLHHNCDYFALQHFYNKNKVHNSGTEGVNLTTITGKSLQLCMINAWKHNTGQQKTNM